MLLPTVGLEVSEKLKNQIMKREKVKSSSIIALWALVQLAVAAAPSHADMQHGRQLALRWCADCHVVASNQRQPTGEAPPFATIASRPDFNVERLAYFLLAPHPKMPSMSLTRAEAIDLATYIASLKK